MEFFSQFVQAHGFLVLVGVVIVGYVTVYFFLRRTLNRAIEKLSGEWTEEFRSLMVAVRLEEKPKVALVAPPVAPVSQPVAIAPPPAPTVVKREEVTPETLLVIAAAVTAFLGKKVRIRSAKMLYSHESPNAWSQQG